MKKLIVILFFFLIILLMPTGLSTGRGNDCEHFTNPIPENGAEDVPISQGATTCINLKVDDGCYVNVTFQWFNSSGYFSAFLDWLFFGGEFPNSNDYIYNYSHWNSLKSSQQLCAYNDNVSCYTEGEYEYGFDWRVVAEFDCRNKYSYTEVCYYYFYPEECSVFYIYPPVNETGICPCCDSICVGIDNINGNPMNMTIYGKIINENYFIWNKYTNITNNTYCFCMDGFYFDNNSDYIIKPMQYNTTYVWYINVTDTVTGESYDSDIYYFTTAESPDDCPCGEELDNPCANMLALDDVSYFYFIGILGLIGVFAMAKLNNRRR
jgi:hypothetical protein